MKKILLVMVFIFFASTCVRAEDSWDDISGVQDLWNRQKVITDKEFEETIQKFYKSKSQPKKKKSKHKELMQPVHEIPDDEVIARPQVWHKEFTAILLIPAMLINHKDIVMPGYYKVSASKNDSDEYFLHLFQGTGLVTSVRAYKSKDDYDQPEINYVKILPYSDELLKIIYGSLDYNVEAILRMYDN